jgi:beta-phosphoglucomutase
MQTDGSRKAIILDMDGVLVDTEPIHVDSFRVFLKRRSITAPEEFLFDLIGHSVEENMRDIYRTYFPDRHMDLERDVREREDIYLDLLRNSKIRPQPGLEDLILICKDSGVPIGLASSSIREQIRTVLEKLTAGSVRGIDYHQVFTAIISGEDVARKKPAPDIYLMALNRLGVQSAGSLAVEDSPAGIFAAQAAGLKCVAVKTAYIAPARVKIADVIIGSLEELPRLLYRLKIITQGE